MPLVNVLINGRAYTVACDDGEEPHLRELGQFLDKRVRELAGTVGGQASESRLLLMAGLIISDELSESMTRVDELEKELAALRGNGAAHNGHDDSLAEILEKAAARIETIADQVARS
jgi:cell division protein ZapA